MLRTYCLPVEINTVYFNWHCFWQLFSSKSPLRNACTSWRYRLGFDKALVDVQKLAQKQLISSRYSVLISGYSHWERATSPLSPAASPSWTCGGSFSCQVVRGLCCVWAFASLKGPAPGSLMCVCGNRPKSKEGTVLTRSPIIWKNT